METIKCTYCHRETDEGGGTTWDRVYPLSLGGTNCRKNKVICCSNCNQIKSALTIYKFKDLIRKLISIKAIPTGYTLEDLIQIRSSLIEMIKKIEKHKNRKLR